MQLSFVDISRAYFNAHVDPDDPIFVQLPPEAKAPPGTCARLCRHMYGTQRAADGWQEECSCTLREVHKMASSEAAMHAAASSPDADSLIPIMVAGAGDPAGPAATGQSVAVTPKKLLQEGDAKTIMSPKIEVELPFAESEEFDTMDNEELTKVVQALQQQYWTNQRWINDASETLCRTDRRFDGRGGAGQKRT